MTQLAQRLQAPMIRHLLRKGTVTYTPPAELYVGLATSGANLETGADDELTAVNAPGYARQTVNFRNRASTDLEENDVDVVFSFTDATPTFTHFFVAESATVGSNDGVIYGPLDAPVTIGTGNNQYRLPIGALIAAMQ
ncbi:MAG: hypothetical protein AAF196_17045 [Planctomycetota bacterium]